MGLSNAEWLPFLLDTDGQSFYVAANGTILKSSIPKPLRHMPANWQDIELVYGRSQKYYSLDRTYTNNFEFVKDAAKIIRNYVYTKQGFESKLFFMLAKKNATTGVFEKYFKAELDLSLMVDEVKGMVKVPVIDESAAKYIKANESVVYEILYDGDTSVLLDGVKYITEGIVPSDTVLAIRPIAAFKELVRMVTGGKYGARSSLLEKYERLVLSSGDAIRKEEGAKLKTTFSDFYNSYSKILGGAIGIDYNTGEVVFEDRSYFFNEQEIIEIGSVADLEVHPANNYMFNSVKTGYSIDGDKSDSDIVFKDVNITHTYTTPITRVKKELDLVVKYIASVSVIENYRLKLFNTLTKDWDRKDSKVFIFNINDRGNTLRRPNYSIFYNGIWQSILLTPHYSFYNIDILSPKRILLANGDIVGGGVSFIPDGLVAFTSTDTDYLPFATQIDNISVVEFGSVRVSEFKDAFFRPFIFKFRTKITTNILLDLQTKNNGVIKFSYNGTEFKGFAQKCSTKPIYKEEQEWEVLSSFSSSISALENIETALYSETYLKSNMGIISHRTPLKFIPLGTTQLYNTIDMDYEWFTKRARQKGYSYVEKYVQKWQSNDNFTLQFITAGVDAYCEVINCNKEVVRVFAATQVPSLYITGELRLFEFVVNCNILPQDDELYFIAKFGIGAGEKQFISEPCIIRDKWEGTVLIEAYDFENKPDMVFSEGYVSKVRVEGGVYKYTPDSSNTSFEDNGRGLVNIQGTLARKFNFLIGGGGVFGVPDWMIDKIARLILLSSFKIEGISYAVEDGEKFEEVASVEGVPTNPWGINVRQVTNSLGLDIDASGTGESPITVVYNINTKGFSTTASPANQQDSLIQVVDIEG